MKTINTLVVIVIDGCVIGTDPSGQGHAWRPATADDCPTHIQEELAGEIIDGQRRECQDYVASNGVHYHWFEA